MKDGHTAINRIGNAIVNDKKSTLFNVSDGKSEELTRSSVKGRDILSTLSEDFLIP